jgi:hypothetical protein
MEVTSRIVVPFENTVVTKIIKNLSTFYGWKNILEHFHGLPNIIRNGKGESEYIL